MKKSNNLILALFLLFFIYTLMNLKQSTNSSMQVLTIFSKTILPSLLLFLILNQLIIKVGIVDLLAYFLQFITYPLFKINGKGASIILISILNGFPSSTIFSSILLKDNQISKDEAQRLINSMFFPSVSFLFAVIGINLNNSKLFISLILSLYLAGFIHLYFSSFQIKDNNTNSYLTYSQTKSIIINKLKQFHFTKDFKEIMHYSFLTLLNILGIILFFSIPCNIISTLIKGNFSLLLNGIMEFSLPSIKILSLHINKIIITYSLTLILTFSGLSSIMQASIFISESNLSIKSFIKSRIIVTFVSIILLTIFLFFL